MARIAFIGVGDISGIYLKNVIETFDNLELIGVCDLIPEKAQAAVEKYPQIKKIYKDMYEAFADPEVDIILNITRAYQHYDVTKAALMAGKHVYSEKPLGINLEEGEYLVNLAKEKGLYLGGAPDTFMGASIQTARKLLDGGIIGEIIGIRLCMAGRGMET